MLYTFSSYLFLSPPPSSSIGGSSCCCKAHILPLLPISSLSIDNEAISSLIPTILLLSPRNLSAIINLLYLVFLILPQTAHSRQKRSQTQTKPEESWKPKSCHQLVKIHYKEKKKRQNRTEHKHQTKFSDPKWHDIALHYGAMGSSIESFQIPKWKWKGLVHISQSQSGKVDKCEQIESADGNIELVHSCQNWNKYLTVHNTKNGKQEQWAHEMLHLSHSK